MIDDYNNDNDDNDNGDNNNDQKMLKLLNTLMEGFKILFLDSEMTSDISWMPSPFSNHVTVSFENLVLEQLCMTFVKKTNF